MPTNFKAWFGTTTRPVTLFVEDAAFNIQGNSTGEEAGSDVVTTAEAVAAVLTQPPTDDGIFILGLSFGVFSSLDYENISNTLHDGKNVGTMAAPSYPSNWNGARRGIETVLKTSCKLSEIVVSGNKFRDILLLRSLELSLRMVLAWSFWDGQQSSYSVKLLGTFAVSLPRLVGHRDYLRTVLPQPNIAVPSVQAKGCFLQSPQQGSSRWYPGFIGSPNNHCVTLLLIPDIAGGGQSHVTPSKKEDAPFSQEHQIVTSAKEGIFISFTRDIGAGVTKDNANKEGRYFEYVRYESPNHLQRKVFLAVGCAITFPSGTAFRLYSNKCIDMQVAVFIHAVTDLKGTVGTAGVQKSISDSLPVLQWPFPSDSLQQERFGVTGVHTARKRSTTSLVLLGCIPSFKGIFHADLRVHVKKEVDARSEDRSVNTQPPEWEQFHYVSTVGMKSLFNNYGDPLQTTKSRQIVLSVLPLNSIWKKSVQQNRSLEDFASNEFDELLGNIRKTRLVK